jgi:hypothetical protein
MVAETGAGAGTGAEVEAGAGVVAGAEAGGRTPPPPRELLPGPQDW